MAGRGQGHRRGAIDDTRVEETDKELGASPRSTAGEVPVLNTDAGAAAREGLGRGIGEAALRWPRP
jgi:hypothetical protein